MFRQQKKYQVIPVSSEVSRTLQTIVTDYEHTHQSNPHCLRESIATDDVWRFFVDGIRQGNGWLKFEKTEPGYLKAMYQAFHESFDFTGSIDVQNIKNIHRVALQGVQNTNYEEDYINGVGEFRGDDHRRGGTYISEFNATTDGLFEALYDPNHPFLTLSIEFTDFNDQRKVIDINQSTMTLLRNMREELSDPEKVTPVKLAEIAGHFCDKEYLAYLSSELVLASRLFSRLSQTENNRDLAECLYNLIQSREYMDENYSFLLRSVQENGSVMSALNDEMTSLINTYNLSMLDSNEPINKLSVIISFIQACEQLHPFSDANCRVFCMLLLNHLLMRNGFPPTILDDPNRFDAYSRSELLQEVLRGMRNTLILGINYQLYGFDTVGCIVNLLENNQTDVLAHYEDLQKLEEQNRQLLEEKPKSVIKK